MATCCVIRFAARPKGGWIASGPLAPRVTRQWIEVLTNCCTSPLAEVMFRFDHLAFALLDASHVDSEFIHFEAEFSAAPRQPCYLSRSRSRSCSASTRYRARTAEPFSLDRGSAMTLIGHRPGCPLTGLSAS